MLSKEQIKFQLSEWISDDFQIIDIGELEMMSKPDGLLIEARDEYLRKYRARLASLETTKSKHPKLFQDAQKVVEILEALEPDEVLTYWEVKTAEHEYAGVSSRLGMVSFYGPHPRSDPKD